ncbi:alkyl hydroperoxide reductase AhpD [Streptomyces spiroverticillatus]|uniref:Alkyl hydroperoxide reductase AhpD n=1 Tax=Streptomyces finlayi TaxID=67296 RepID=A0A918X262_9ACTN|nr:carboxymuconolactone decarboxylase family protein [Streptomyces finlayi]GHA23638.1 alkyl hydroperoxide reductase AhpD [Streptomyces spiroverticillatus]GHD04870.1 alkyl hydroperoxide reductase AhpD [Streptomyces finlayi]
MEARIDFKTNPVGAKALKHIVSAGMAIMDRIPAATRELVALRISQINGCAYCVDMHTKDAAHAGETAIRINLVAVWREAPVFTEAERAALELAEQGTRIADAAGGVPDDVWANAAKHYTEDELCALVSAIAVLNALNRLNIITKTPAGDYRPGQYA